MSAAKPSPVSWSARRVRVIAGLTVQATWRLRLAGLLAAAAAGLLLGGQGLRHFNFGQPELQFLRGFGFTAIGVGGVLLAALGTAQVFFDDLRDGLAAAALTRSLGRGEYLLGKLAGMALLLAGYTAALGGLLVFLLWRRQGQLGGADAMVVPVLAGCGLLWLKSTLVAALTLVICSYAGSPLFAGLAGLFMAMVGQLRPWADATGIGWLRFWPDLSRFEPGSVESAPVVVGTWLGWVGVLWGVATYVFRRREL